MRNLETILVNSYPSKSIVGRSGAGRSVGEVVDREDDAEAEGRREVLRDLGVVGPVGAEHPRLREVGVVAWLAIAARRKRQAASRTFTKVDVNQLMHLHSFGGAGESAGPSSGPGSPPPPKDAPPKEWEEKFV